MAIPCWNLWRQ